MIAELGRRAPAADDPAALMASAVSLVARALDVESCQVLELLPPNGPLLLRAGSGWRGGRARRATILVPESLFGRALSAGEPVVSPRLDAEKRRAAPDLLPGKRAVCGLAVPIVSRDPELPFGVLAALSARPRRFDEDDLWFAQVVANILAGSLIQSREQDLRRRLMERVISAQEDERRRIASELHDDTGQALASLLVGLRSVADAGSLEEARDRAAQLRAIAAEAVEEVGRIARDLHPSVLRDVGLGPALARHAAEHARLLGIEISVAARLGSRRLPGVVETALYRIAQLAIANAARHARARHVEVVLRRARGFVDLAVKDDGRGFDVERALAAAPSSGRLGLHDIRERAGLMGGSVGIDSKRGRGTLVRARIPLRDANTDA